VVSSTPPPHFTPGKDPVPIVQEAGWAPGPVSTGAENLAPTGIRSSDRPARSQSLYRLSYLAHYLKSRSVKARKGVYQQKLEKVYFVLCAEDFVSTGILKYLLCQTSRQKQDSFFSPLLCHVMGSRDVPFTFWLCYFSFIFDAQLLFELQTQLQLVPQSELTPLPYIMDVQLFPCSQRVSQLHQGIACRERRLVGCVLVLKEKENCVNAASCFCR
jgi:hypothetical protein